MEKLFSAHQIANWFKLAEVFASNAFETATIYFYGLKFMTIDSIENITVLKLLFCEGHFPSSVSKSKF